MLYIEYFPNLSNSQIIIISKYGKILNEVTSYCSLTLLSILSKVLETIL